MRLVQQTGLRLLQIANIPTSRPHRIERFGYRSLWLSSVAVACVFNPCDNAANYDSVNET
jgi:hypothetical protein